MLDFTSQFKKTLKNSQMTHFHHLNTWTQERKNAAFFLKPPEILFLFYLKTDSEEKNIRSLCSLIGTFCRGRHKQRLFGFKISLGITLFLFHINLPG